MLLRNVFEHRAHRQLCDDHVATFLAAVYALLEGALVNYVVPGSLPPTRRRRAHEISLFKVVFHVFVQLLGIYSAPTPIQIHV